MRVGITLIFFAPYYMMEKRETQPKMQLRVNSVVWETTNHHKKWIVKVPAPSLIRQPPVAAKMEITVILKIKGVDTRSLFNKVASDENSLNVIE